MNIFKPARYHLILLAIFIMGSLFPTACSGMTDIAATEPTVVVENESQALEVSASGEVVPGQWASLAFPSGATNLKILVKAGDQVIQGQDLIGSDDQNQRAALLQAQALLAKAELALEQLNNIPSDAALASAEAVLANAEVNYDRLDRAGARQIEMDAAQAQIDSAQAALDELKAGATEKQIASAEQDIQVAQDGIKQAEKALEEAVLNAPFDGQVIEILANSFETVAPAQTVLVLADLSSLRVETTDLSEVDVARIQVGDTARVVFDALPNQNFTGKVGDIALRSSGGSAVYYRVTILLDEIPDGLRWGMSAFITIP